MCLSSPTTNGGFQARVSNPFAGPKADAVSGLAKFLFNAAINGYRQREIKQTIHMGHKYLPQIIDGLSDVTGDYQATLSDEEKNVVQIQTILFLDRKKPEDKRVFKLTNTEIDEKLFKTKKMIEFIEIKDKAAQDYKTILLKIADTHEKLYISTNELNSLLLIIEIQKYSSELLPLIYNIREAFSS